MYKSKKKDEGKTGGKTIKKNKSKTYISKLKMINELAVKREYFVVSRKGK